MEYKNAQCEVFGTHFGVIKNVLFFYLQPDFVRRGSPLQMAVQAHKPDVIKLLIEEFNADVEFDVHEGATVLFEAVYIRDVAAIQQLLKYGACVNHRDWYGRTALFMAVLMQQSIMVELLVRHGANVNLLGYGEAHEDRCFNSCQGTSPLQAALHGYDSLYYLRLIDDNPAALNAAMNEHIDIIRHLVPHCSNFDATVPSNGTSEEDSYRTLSCVELCFMIESKQSDLRVSKHLLRNGATTRFHAFYDVVKQNHGCHADVVTASFVKLCRLSGCDFKQYFLTLAQEKEQGPAAGQDHRTKHVHALVKDCFSQPLTLAELSIMAIRKSIGSRHLWGKIDALPVGIPRSVKDLIQFKTYMY